MGDDDERSIHQSQILEALYEQMMQIEDFRQE